VLARGRRKEFQPSGTAHTTTRRSHPLSSTTEPRQPMSRTTGSEWIASTLNPSKVNPHPPPSSAVPSRLPVPVHTSPPAMSRTFPTILSATYWWETMRRATASATFPVGTMRRSPSEQSLASHISRQSRVTTRPLVDTLRQEKDLLERKLAAVNFLSMVTMTTSHSNFGRKSHLALSVENEKSRWSFGNSTKSSS
jgi:hypothetical protein